MNHTFTQKKTRISQSKNLGFGDEICMGLCVGLDKRGDAPVMSMVLKAVLGALRIRTGDRFGTRENPVDVSFGAFAALVTAGGLDPGRGDVDQKIPRQKIPCRDLLARI